MGGDAVWRGCNKNAKERPSVPIASHLLHCGGGGVQKERERDG